MASLRLTSIPWNVARSFDPEEVLAASIIAGETHGGIWDWNSMSWQKPTF